MDKSKTIDVFDRRAVDYQDKFMDFDLYDDTFDLFCESIPKAGAEILDLACGPGNITRYLLGKRPDFRIFGIDLAPNMIALAKANNPTAEFGIMDCREISNIQQRYDAIICGFGLPYLSKEETAALIRNASGLLNAGGILYLSTMEDDYSKSGPRKSSDGKDETYQYFHEAGFLTAVLEENNFKVFNLQRKDFPGPDGTTTDLVLIAKK